MNCCVTDLRDKKVINTKNACLIGNVCDVEIDSCSGSIVNIIVTRRNGLLGLICRDDTIKICWNDINVIGDETILVCIDTPTAEHIKKKNIFEGLFR